MKLNLGAGSYILEGYINIDIRNAPGIDLVWDLRKPLPYEPEYVEEILAYHVVEHLDRADLPEILEGWRTLLKKGGCLIIEAPDMERLLPEMVKKWQQGIWDWEMINFILYAHGENGHRVALSPSYLKTLLGDGWRISEEEPIRETGFPTFRLRCEKLG